MRVLGREVLESFKGAHADVRGQLDAWFREAEKAKWTRWRDIKDRYPSASDLPNDIVIFNIKGNKYRIAVKVNYQYQIVKIEKVGTHAEYSKWSW